MAIGRCYGPLWAKNSSQQENMFFKAFKVNNQITINRQPVVSKILNEAQEGCNLSLNAASKLWVKWFHNYCFSFLQQVYSCGISRFRLEAIKLKQALCIKHIELKIQFYVQYHMDRNSTNRDKIHRN